MARGVLGTRFRRDRFFQPGLFLVGGVGLAARWGAMVADGRDLLRVAPWVSFAPGLAIGVAVLGFNLVGDVLREVYDPKLGREP